MLKDKKVLEFQGLVPSMFCGMILADQGAQVIIAARRKPAIFSIPFQNNTMNRYKKSVCISFDNKEDRHFLQTLIKQSDIIIDPYRPGVLQKLGFGPETIFKINKKAVILRVSGYGQSGQMAMKPGHDLNYLSVSGLVPLLNHNSEGVIPQFPANYLADFVASSLGITAVIGALKISEETGVGRVVDCSLAEGCHYYTNLLMGKTKKQKRIQSEYVVHEGKEWFITSSKKIDNKQEIKKIIDEMLLQKSKYYSKDGLQISQLKPLLNHTDQLQQLHNIFDSSNASIAKSVPTRGSDDAQIRSQLLMPKL